MVPTDWRIIYSSRPTRSGEENKLKAMKVFESVSYGGIEQITV